MVLRLPQPPPESEAAARGGLATLTRAGRFNSADRPSVTVDELVLSRPHQVFLLGLDDLTDGRGLDAARSVGWRYLVEHHNTPVALAETLIDPDGRHVLGQVNYGPFVAGTARALAVAEARDTVEGEDADLLHIPALHFLALRVRDSTAPAQLIPIAPTLPDLEASRAYPADELLTQLTELARAEQDQPDRSGT